jgi:hypothetical protein
MVTGYGSNTFGVLNFFSMAVPLQEKRHQDLPSKSPNHAGFRVILTLISVL